MATTNKVVKELLLTHTQLTTDNPILKNGQKVVVTGISNVINKPNKIGDGTTAYNNLPFLDVIKVQTSADYDIAGFAVDNNDVEVTNIGSSSINVTVDTVTVVITAGKIGKWRRVSGAWVQVVLPATDDVTHKIYSFDISAGNQIYTMDAVTADMQIVELFWSGGDGSSFYFQVKDSAGTEIFRTYTSGNITYISDGSVFKVNDYKEILMDYDISAANKVHYLSKITGYPQDSRLSWSGGDGTYKLTISDDFGTTTLAYEGEGEGNAKLESDAAAWKVVEYEDKLWDTSIWKNCIKGITGLYISGYLNVYADNITELDMYARLNERLLYAPAVQRLAMASGMYRDTADYHLNAVYKSASDTFLFQAQTVGGGRNSVGLTSTNTGDWNDTNKLGITVELNGTPWLV